MVTQTKTKPREALLLMIWPFISGKIILSKSSIREASKLPLPTSHSCNDAPQIFFLGVGSAYRCIINLLETRCGEC